MSSSFAPPAKWQGDLAQQPQPQQSAVLTTTPEARDLDGVSVAWKHIKNVVRDDGKSTDLHDLLQNSVKETAYSPQVAGSPALLKPRTPALNAMPAMVLERYRTCQTVCFCGAFPAIRRAWASVDNSLFLWRFDRWNDVPVEYSGEEQAICAVGLAKPLQGVFVPAIQHVLVLCTTVEVVLLGICISDTDAAAGDLQVQPLPMHACPTDGVTMTCVTATESGRVFMGGADGHLYELCYDGGGRGLRWGAKPRCYKKDISAGLTAYLPSFLPKIWQRPSAVVELSLDSWRHILYLRLQGGPIQVYDLGVTGAEAFPKRVAEVTDFMAMARAASGGRDIFGGRSSTDIKGAAVVHMAPIPPGESASLHMVAITADGRRVFCTTQPPLQYYGAPVSRVGAGARPQALRAEVVRATPLASPGAAAASSSSSGASRPLVAAFYRGGVFVMGQAADGSGHSMLVAAARDSSLPPVGTAMGAHVGGEGLRETVSSLDFPVPGDICSLQAMSGASAAASTLGSGLHRELITQITTPAPQFVLVSTAGVLELEKRRPADMLQTILEQKDAQKLEAFLRAYGAPEVAAMCLLLITHPSITPSTVVLQQAKAALDNPRLMGEPQLRDPSSAAAAENVSPNQHGFDMGVAVPVAEPEWSGAHVGLCLYVGRLLQPLWESAVIGPPKPGDTVLDCRINSATLEVLESRLRALAAFLADRKSTSRWSARGAGRPSPGAASYYTDPSLSGVMRGIGGGNLGSEGITGMPHAKRQRLEDAVRQENAQVKKISGLLARTGQACFLLRMLSIHNLRRLSARLDDSWRRKLVPLKLRDWATSSEGEAAATQLISVLVTEHLAAPGRLADDLSAQLQQGCPAFFQEADRTYYRASDLLQRAGTAVGSDRDILTRDALALMLQVPLACDLGRVTPQLADRRQYDGVVDLPLRKAQALDPNDVASQPTAEGETARQVRQDSCYAHTLGVLRGLYGQSSSTDSGQSRMSAQEQLTYRTLLLQKAGKAQDPHFREALFATLAELGATTDLLSLDSPALERYLRTQGGLSPAGPDQLDLAIGPLDPSQVQHLRILARLHVKRSHYAQAAGVLQLLGLRKSGAGEEAVSLSDRQDALSQAVLQARSCGDEGMEDQVEVRLRSIDLQQRLATAIEASPPGGDAEAGATAAAELAEAPRTLAQLFNDYAAPARLWALAIECIDLARYEDDANVRHLWDLYLLQCCEEATGDAGSSASAEESADQQVEACCRAVEGLGPRLQTGSYAFPAQHVASRLEELSQGVWPQSQSPCSDGSQRITAALVQACRGETWRVLQLYDAMLAVRGGDLHGRELHTASVRLHVLASTLLLLQATESRLRAQAPAGSAWSAARASWNEATLAAEACVRYASEARRLQPASEGEALAKQFDTLHAAFQQTCP